jgi:tetraacyldisaccharide 4'-kinase
LDDGFQHWKVRRDLDIVLIDAADPFGNGWPLPLGTLRELKFQLKRAGLFVITRADLASERLPSLRAELGRINPRVKIIETAHVPVAVEEPFRTDGGVRTTDLTVIQGRVCACSAIGSPMGFAATLESLGADIVHQETFIDHHVYTAQDVRRIVGICRDKKLEKIVTTEKDIVKLVAFKDLFGGLTVLAVAVAVKVTKGDDEITSCLDSILHS